MVNESELLVNVVNENKPKMLIGLNQNGQWSGSEITMFSDVDAAPPAERQHLTHSVTQAERGKPVASPLGKRVVRQADETAGKGRWRKPTPPRNEVDRS